MDSKNVIRLFSAIIISELAGVIGAFLTVSEVVYWYADLIKPSLNPPNWAFGPVWVTLYFLMGISAYLIWKRIDENSQSVQGDVKEALAIFGFQLLLNAMWSIIFFGMHGTGAALIDIIGMWFAILWTIIKFWKLSRTAAYLLIPYIAWVTFAIYLNFSIWILN